MSPYLLNASLKSYDRDAQEAEFGKLSKNQDFNIRKLRDEIEFATGITFESLFVASVPLLAP